MAVTRTVAAPLRLLALCLLLWMPSTLGIYYIGNVPFDTNQCAINYTASTMASTDLFPAKVYPLLSSTWNVTYFNTFKVVGAACTNRQNCVHTYVLYQCGTPQPTITAFAVTRYISIPVRRVAVQDMPILAFIELLGVRSTVRMLATTAFVATPCVLQMYNLGEIELAPLDAYGDLNVTQAAVEDFDASFVEYSNTPTTAPVVLFDEIDEKSTLAVSEYIHYTSLFYNKELVVQQTQRNFQYHISCHTALAPARQPPLNVLWWNYDAVYNFGWWPAPTCPNYYCDLISNAKANLLLNMSLAYNPTTYSYDVTNATVAVAQQADFWIFSDAWTNETYNTLAAMPWVTNLSVWKNHRIYAIDGSGINDWFQTRFAEPDLLFSDVLATLYTDAVIGHTRVWLRNVFNETVTSRPPPSSCVNTIMPLLVNDDPCPLPPTAPTPSCVPISQLYISGQDLCETMFEQSFRYEPDLDVAYTFNLSSQADSNAVSTRLNLTSMGLPGCSAVPGMKSQPTAEPGLSGGLCSAWQGSSCCSASSVATLDALQASFGSSYRWDRCGTLSQACQNYFVQHQCFMMCDANVGYWWANPKDSVNNSSTYRKSIYRLPVQQSFCDAWFMACKDDLFCASPSGDFYSCARNPPNSASNCDIMGPMSTAYLSNSGPCIVSQLTAAVYSDFYYCPGLKCASGYTPVDYGSVTAPYVWCDESNNTYVYRGCARDHKFVAESSSCTAIVPTSAAYVGTCTISQLTAAEYTGYYYCPGLACASGYTPSDYRSVTAPYVWCDWWNNTLEYWGCDKPYTSSCDVVGPINAAYVTLNGSCTTSNLVATFWSAYFHCPGLACASGYTPSDSGAPYLYCDSWNNTYEYNGCDGMLAYVMKQV